MSFGRACTITQPTIGPFNPTASWQLSHMSLKTLHCRCIYCSKMTDSLRCQSSIIRNDDESASWKPPRHSLTVAIQKGEPFLKSQCEIIPPAMYWIGISRSPSNTQTISFSLWIEVTISSFWTSLWLSKPWQPRQFCRYLNNQSSVVATSGEYVGWAKKPFQ